MTEERVQLEIVFPKIEKETISHSFELDKEASCILEYVLSKYPDVSPRCQLFRASGRGYRLVEPEEQLSKLDLRANHQMLVMPESYKVKFVDGQTGKEHNVTVFNSFTVAEVMRWISMVIQGIDPHYYQVFVQSKILVQDELITEQVPFATTITFQLAPISTLYDIITQEFVEHGFSALPKEAIYTIALILMQKFGKYSSTERSLYEKELRMYVPHVYSENAVFMKTVDKNVLEIYKKMKMGDDAMSSVISYIMKLPHFSALVLNGERSFTVAGKSMTKDKVTFSLNYSTLRTFKQNSPTLLEEFHIWGGDRDMPLMPSKMDKLQLDSLNTITFQYDIPDRGIATVRCKGDEMRQLYDTLSRRRAPPRSSSLHSGTGTEGRVDDTMAVPAFILMFNLFGEIPRSELTRAVSDAALIFLDRIHGEIDKFKEDLVKGSSVVSERQLTGTVRVATSIVYAVDRALGSRLKESFRAAQHAGGVMKLWVGKMDEVRARLGEQSAFKKMVSARKNDNEMDAVCEKLAKKGDKVAKSIAALKDTVTSCQNAMKARTEDKSRFPVRPFLMNTLRSMLLTLLAADWVNESASQSDGSAESIKKSISSVIRLASSVSIYVGESGKFRAELREFVGISDELAHTIESVPMTDKQYIQMVHEAARKDLEDGARVVEDFFKKQPDISQVDPLSVDEIQDATTEDPRPMISMAHQVIDRLSATVVDNLARAVDDLEGMRTLFLKLLDIAPRSTYDPMIAAFNGFKSDVERSYVADSINTLGMAANRCERALEGLKEAMSPAKDLRQQLSQRAADDPRTIALSAIIDYLDANGPLYTGGPTHTDMHKFINRMDSASAGAQVELAYTIESYVPEQLRKLSECCDRTHDLYKEIDGELTIADISRSAQTTFGAIAVSAIEIRKALKKQERETTAKYRTLNMRLWRMMLVFGQLATDESPGSIGHATFIQCRDAIKTLIEESAYDVKRDRQFLPFIDQFIEKLDTLIDSPRDSHGLEALGHFLMLHQTRPGFYKAAKALSEFNHFVIVSDSDRAARELTEQVIAAQKFRAVSLLISGLRRRFVALLVKVDTAMRTPIIMSGRQGVDLRGDYYYFLRRYTDEIFIIFSQLVVAKSTNETAIQSLTVGCEAIEKLFPLVVNIEVPAPYFARSVCGIVFSSMEALISECKRLGGKAAQSSDFAFTHVRELLFNVRRKIAEAELDAISAKTGTSIADMYAVIERDRKIADEQVNFQRSIRKRKW